MKENASKILGTVFFVLLISLLIFLIFFTKKNFDKKRVEIINIKGNSLLSQNDYLNYSKLGDNQDKSDLTLYLIKERLEHHPYIGKANVEFETNNKVNAEIVEKVIKAVVLRSNETLLISENFEILPLLQNTKFTDLPIISNPGNINNIKKNSFRKTADFIEAFKIIDAIEMTEKNMIKNLSEINLRNGGDIVLTFSGLDNPVIFGKKRAAEKAVYLQEIFRMINRKNLIAGNINYIDLRFNNEVFIGGLENTGFTE